MPEPADTQKWIYRDLIIEEISFVDKGSNGPSHVLVLKAATDEERQALLTSLRTLVGSIDSITFGKADEVERLKLKLTQAMRDRLFGAMENASSPVELEEIFWREMSALRKAEGVPPEEVVVDEKQVKAKIDEAVKAATEKQAAEIAELKKANAEQSEKLKAAEAKVTKLEKGAEDPDDPYAGLDEKVAKALRAKDVETAAAKAEVEKLREERDVEKRVATLKAELPGIANADEVGSTLVRIQKSAKAEDFDKLVETLKALHEQVDKSKLFGSRGADPTDPDRSDDPVEQVEKKAKAMMAEDDKLAYGDAVQKVLNSDEKLYKRYRKVTLKLARKQDGDDE